MPILKNKKQKTENRKQKQKTETENKIICLELICLKLKI